MGAGAIPRDFGHLHSRPVVTEEDLHPGYLNLEKTEAARSLNFYEERPGVRQ